MRIGLVVMVVRLAVGMIVIVRMIVGGVVMVMMVIVVAAVMMVAVAMIMPMIIMVMRMIAHHFQRSRLGMGMQRRPRQSVPAAEFLVPAGGIAIAAAGAVLKAASDALHVMVVALLLEADFRLETERLLAIFAHLAVHQILPIEDQIGRAHV